MTRTMASTLASYSLFSGLDKRELGLVASIVTSQNVPAASIIINEDEEGDSMFLLLEGIVEVIRTLTVVTSRHDFGTKERTFVRLRGEDRCFFGELALVGCLRRSATVKAVSACFLLVIRKDDFHDLCMKEPHIGYEVVSRLALVIAGNLRKTNDDVLKLTTALSLALSGDTGRSE